jgi:hypothetical protein
MSARTAFAAAAVLTIGLAAGALAQTAEENRYAGELKACAALPEPQRKPCEDAVKAKIKVDWNQRIEAESRRRHSR